MDKATYPNLLVEMLEVATHQVNIRAQRTPLIYVHTVDITTRTISMTIKLLHLWFFVLLLLLILMLWILKTPFSCGRFC